MFILIGIYTPSQAFNNHTIWIMIKAAGHVAQLVKCLTADPGVESLIPAHSHTFREIDHEIISMVILLPSADSRRVVVSYNHVHKVLVNPLFKLAEEKCG